MLGSFYLLLSVFEASVAIFMQSNPVCYGDLGCFSTDGDFFDITKRPVNLYPENPERINTQFLLYTIKNPLRGQLISRYNPTTIKKSNFDPEKPIKFISHGFQSDSSAFNKIRDALLAVEDVNYIAVDWSHGAGIPYIQATANTRVVGAEIAMLVIYLQENFNISLHSVHIIGHSLGAHIAGYAGDILNGSIARISGLDPAEPYFRGMPKSVRLDESDAQFVDVIHTDSLPIFLLGFGIYDPLGDLDFYPDGGKEVNSCDLPNLISNLAFNALETLTSDCSHGRAVDLFADSIISPCPYTAHACDSYTNYLSGQCTSCGENGSDCQRMGYFAYPNPQSFNKSFFLTTGQRPPLYCNYHWLLRFQVKNIARQQEVEGKLKIKIYGNYSTYVPVELTDSERNFKPGEHYKFLYSLSFNVKVIRSIDLEWSLKQNFFSGISSAFGKRKPRLYIQDVTLESIDVVNTRRERSKLENSAEPSSWKFWGDIHSFLGSRPMNDDSMIQQDPDGNNTTQDEEIAGEISSFIQTDIPSPSSHSSPPYSPVPSSSSSSEKCFPSKKRRKNSSEKMSKRHFVKRFEDFFRIQSEYLTKAKHIEERLLHIMEENITLQKQSLELQKSMLDVLENINE